MMPKYLTPLRKIFMMSLAIVSVLLCLIAETKAQNIQFTQGSVGSGLENSIKIPVMAYPGRGASLPVNLYYSSSVWRLGHRGTVNDVSFYTSITEAIFAENSTAGWKTSLDLPIIEWPKPEDQYYYTGKQFCFVCGSSFRRFQVARVYITMPDGSKHELRQSDQPYEGALRVTGTFYSVDGSRLRYDSWSTTTGTLYMPDGARYVLNGTTAQFIDRHGNTLNYDATARQWTDTLGRVIGVPFPASPIPGQQDYYLPGLPLPYKFIWKNLSESGVITPDPVTGQTPARRPIASHYLPNPTGAPTNYNGNNYPQSTQVSSLFFSQEPDEESNTTYVVGLGQVGAALFDPVVLTEVILPNGLNYKFSYNIFGEIDKIIYPTGAFDRYVYAASPPIGDLKPPYAQANRAVTSRQLSPKGDGSDIATWQYTVTGSPNPFNPSALVISTTAPDGTYSEVRRHNFSAPQQSGTHSNPRFWPFGFEDARQGIIYEERTYDKTPANGGVMLRRTLTDFTWTQTSIPPRIGLPGEEWELAFRNARPTKTVSLILDTGGEALAKLDTFGYNSNLSYALTTGLDRTDVAESHFASVDQPTAQSGTITTISTSYSFPPASSSVMTYKDDPSYQSRHILELVTSSLVRNASGQPVSMAETFYDEIETFPLAAYPDLAGDPGYNNPGDQTVRGNVTTGRRYVDVTAGTYFETHTRFDQCGNLILTWGERDTPPFNESNANSTHEYSSAQKRAYLTKVTSAAPDPSGTHGANAAFFTTSTYDTVTGLLLTSTDANNQTTQYSYLNDQGTNDPLNRLRKVIRADGSWTKYSFGETVGDLFTLTETQQDASRTVKSYQYVDPLGRASRSFMNEDGTNFIADDKIYDPMGRVWKVSNPYRTTTRNGVADLSHTSDWTVSHYDALGRVDSVTLQDATIVQTSYQGIYTTATDQAGRQRRQKTDALGRVVRIDEANLGGSIGNVDAPTQPTYFEYDTKGNLVQISQGSGSSTIQHRYFKYDALGRLTYERQVEQAGTHNASDPLTGNSAWSRKLVYDETIGGVSYKGLLTSVFDARSIQTQFHYDNHSRIWQVTYSNGSPTVINNYDQARAGFFNKGHLTEALTAVAGSVPATAQIYNFDLMGRLANNQQTVGASSYTMSYGYDLGGAMTSQTYPSGRVVSYGFDDAARLSQVSSGSTVYANQFDYTTSPGLLKSVNVGNGAVESYTYNSRLQVKSLDLTRSGAQLQHHDYKYGAYDPNTNAVDETKNSGHIARIEGFIATVKQWQQNFAYDSLGRLSSAREFRGDNSQQSWLTNYNYDLFGNRFQYQAQNGGNPFTQIWIEAGQIDSANNRYSSNVDYDNAGNVLIDQKFRQLKFQYDANNRQTQSSNLDDSGAVVSVYDAGGQRVATQIGGALTNVLVYDAMGKLVAEYGTPSPASGTQYVFSDQQSSPRVITGSTGSVVSRHDYAPFGEDLPSNVGMRSPAQGYAQADGVRQKYAGMESDEATGMSHTLWRQYDSLSGRWTAPDPYSASMTVGSPQTFNRYSYVENDPVNKVDPSGLMSVSASQSWGDVSGTFWANSFDFNAPHFGGPATIAEAAARHDRWVDIDRAGGKYGDDDYPSSPGYVGDGIVDSAAGETAADEAGSTGQGDADSSEGAPQDTSQPQENQPQEDDKVNSSVKKQIYRKTNNGLEIQLRAKVKTNTTYVHYNWVQTVTTTDPLGGNPANTPYPDHDAGQATPFYWNPAEQTQYETAAQAEGAATIFYDRPQRPYAGTMIMWTANLSLVGIKSDGTFDRLRNYTYGFRIDASGVHLGNLKQVK